MSFKTTKSNKSSKQSKRVKKGESVGAQVSEHAFSKEDWNKKEKDLTDTGCDPCFS